MIKIATFLVFCAFSAQSATLRATASVEVVAPVPIPPASELVGDEYQTDGLTIIYE